jgi:hypothetical protein
LVDILNARLKDEVASSCVGDATVDRIAGIAAGDA